MAFEFVADIVKKYINSEILPQLATIKETLKNLEKDFDTTHQSIRDLSDKYDKINERISKLEGSSSALEETLIAKLENHLLKQKLLEK